MPNAFGVLSPNLSYNKEKFSEVTFSRYEFRTFLRLGSGVHLYRELAEISVFRSKNQSIRGNFRFTDRKNNLIGETSVFGSKNQSKRNFAGFRTENKSTRGNFGFSDPKTNLTPVCFSSDGHLLNSL